MKKSYAFLVVFFLLSQFLLAEGQSDQTLEAKLNKGLEITRNGISLQADFDKKLPAEYELVATFIKMKKIYEPNRTVKLSSNDWFSLNEIKRIDINNEVTHEVIGSQKPFEIHPFDNLDIYVSSNGDKYPIDNFGIKVTVTIPYEKLKDINRSTNPQDQFLLVFDYDEKSWIPITNPRSGIISVTRSLDSISFVIEKWPHDDKMICSGP